MGTVNVAFIKDPHIMLGVNRPLSRIESFFKDMWIKYTSLRDKCLERGITHIIFTGDVFQVKAPSNYDINAIAQYDALFLDLWKDFDIYTIRGNHDMFVNREGMPRDSIFELGVKHGWYKTLDGSPLDLGELIIYGLDFEDDVENLKNKIKTVSGDALKKSFLGKKTAIVLHEHLVPNTKDMFLDSYILYDWFSEFEFDFVVGGHLHKGFKTQTIEGTTFINPWSLTRLERSHYSVDDRHKPSFVHLSIKDGGYETKTIGLKHRPYDKSFTQTVTSASNLMGDISAFKAQLSVAGNMDNIDIGLIRKLSIDLDTHGGSLEKAIEYIESLLRGEDSLKDN